MRYDVAIKQKFEKFRKRLPFMEKMLQRVVDRVIPSLNERTFPAQVAQVFEEELQQHLANLSETDLVALRNAAKKLFSSITTGKFRWKFFVSKTVKQPHRPPESKRYRTKASPRRRKETSKKQRHTDAYVAHLNSPEWKMFRLSVFAERGKRCQRCKREDGIFHLHHLTYDRLGHELPEDVMILCVPCHEKAHGRKLAK